MLTQELQVVEDPEQTKHLLSHSSQVVLVGYVKGGQELTQVFEILSNNLYETESSG